MIAINTLRPQPHYRRAAFDAGLDALGYKLEAVGKPKSKADILLTWNRMAEHEQRADAWERDGGTVLVAENGYLPPSKWSTYAISAHGHNGSGWFPVGTEDRFGPLGFDLQPWCPEGGYILVCGQRGLGSRTMASPRSWDGQTAHRLRAMGHSKVKVRQHPGQVKPTSTLEEDLAGASLCVVWSSAAGVKALTMGVPVVYCAPRWICEGAATRGLETVGAPCRDDEKRLAALSNMSHGQWTVAEIEAGIPFARIMANLERVGA